MESNLGVISVKVFKVLSALTVAILIIVMTGCASAIFDNVEVEKTSYKLQKTPYINAKIVAPEGFQKGAHVTENTILEFYKDSAGVNLSSSFIGSNDSLDEYVKDSKERLEDDILSFMEFSFVDTDGIEIQGENKRAVAFEALHNKVLKKFWVVYVQQGDHIFEITCYAPKADFDTYADDFNAVIGSLEIK